MGSSWDDWRPIGQAVEEANDLAGARNLHEVLLGALDDIALEARKRHPPPP